MSCPIEKPMWEESEGGLWPTTRGKLGPTTFKELNPANNHGMNLETNHAPIKPRQHLDFSLVRDPEPEDPAKPYPDS